MPKNKLFVLLVALVVVLAGYGCATPQSKRAYSTGTIIKVTEIEVTERVQGSGNSLEGAIIGGALGSTVGSGDGKKAAIAGGALLGALLASGPTEVRSVRVKEVEIEEDGTGVHFKSVVDLDWASGIRIAVGTKLKYYTEKWWAYPLLSQKGTKLFEPLD